MPPALLFFGWLLPVLSGAELELDGPDIESEDGGIELEEDGVSEPDAGAALWSGALVVPDGALDCMLLSELGGELSGPVPLACCRAQAASASALTDKIIKLRFIKAPHRSWS